VIDLDPLRAQLTRHEDRRLFPYRDSVGKWTIGIGHNLTDDGISDAVCDLIFAEDLAACQDIFAKWPWLALLDPVRQQVLLNMRFQLGFGAFADFHDLITSLKIPDYQAAAVAMYASKWARQVPERAQELATMMQTGQQGRP
jgi:lysozyme